VVAQSAFGNVTSQSFGGEFGVAVRPGIQIFVDGGLIRDAAPSALGSSAQRIAIGIAAVAGSADFHVRQPVTFVVAGVKYIVPVSNTRAQPYVLVGGGFANVNRDVTFSTAAGDVTQFAAIGTDLSKQNERNAVAWRRRPGADAAAVGPRFSVSVRPRSRVRRRVQRQPRRHWRRRAVLAQRRR